MGQFLNKLPGLTATLFAMRLLDGWFKSLPSGDHLKEKCLWSLLTLAVPAIVWNGLALLRQYLADRTSKPHS